MQLKADSIQLKVYSMQLKADSIQLKVYSMQLKADSMQLKVDSCNPRLTQCNIKNLHSFHGWPVAWQPLLSASLTLLEVSQSPVYKNTPTEPDPGYTHTMSTHQLILTPGTHIYVPHNLGICAISRLRCAFLES